MPKKQTASRTRAARHDPLGAQVQCRRPSSILQQCVLTLIVFVADPSRRAGHVQGAQEVQQAAAAEREGPRDFRRLR